MRRSERRASAAKPHMRMYLVGVVEGLGDGWKGRTYQSEGRSYPSSSSAMNENLLLSVTGRRRLLDTTGISAVPSSYL
jgi:hypothetical protein